MSTFPNPDCKSCYHSPSGWWCGSCDAWPCTCVTEEDAMSSTADDRPVIAADADEGGTQIQIAVGDGAWSDVDINQIDDVDDCGRIERAALMPYMTANGNPSVEILIRLKNGRLVHATTTWKLWREVTRVFEASPDSEPVYEGGTH